MFSSKRIDKKESRVDKSLEHLKFVVMFVVESFSELWKAPLL